MSMFGVTFVVYTSLAITDKFKRHITFILSFLNLIALVFVFKLNNKCTVVVTKFAINASLK